MYLDREVFSAQRNSHFDRRQSQAGLVGLHRRSHGVLAENVHGYTTMSRDRIVSAVLQVCRLLYLEELKQHVVEVGGNVDDAEGLVGAFG